MEEHSVFQALFGTVGLYTYWLLYGATALACAYYVYQDAIKQARRALNISPLCWAALAMVSGIWAVAAYWVMQHSSLAVSRDK